MPGRPPRTDDIEVVHTADLPGTLRHHVRGLLDGAFEGDDDDDDRHHTLVGHAALVQRQFAVDGPLSCDWRAGDVW